MRQLMARTRVVHERPLLYLIGELIHNIALIRKYRPNIILFLLSSDKENLILCLDGREFLG